VPVPVPVPDIGRDLFPNRHQETPSITEPPAGASPFDELASGYDDTFTRGAIGALLRRPLWRRLDAAFAPGSRVLELGCGTGEDAVHLGRRGVRVLATDASPGMVAAARRKVAAAGLAERVEVLQLAIEELGGLGRPCPRAAGGDAGSQPGGQGAKELRGPASGDCAGPAASGGNLPGASGLAGAAPFDGGYSSFGGLNCVGDLRRVGLDLAALLRPGARLLLCVMGPLVPWEWVWFGARGEPGKALRRLRPGGAAWRGMTIRYPAIGTVKRAFAPAFRASGPPAALGALLPPSYAEAWAARHPRLLARLDRWERRWESLPPLPWLADHYLLELERR
jgi:SAM-dependent methyltransferase